MSATLLELKGISKRFPGVVALDSVDLEVRAGEVVGLIGENGAGKSTLMKILGGVHQADAGDDPYRRQTGHDPFRCRRHRARHRVHPSGTQRAGQPRRRGQHLHGPRTGLGRPVAADRPPRNQPPVRASPEAAGPRHLAAHAAAGAVARAAADGGNRQGALAERPPHHHG